MLVKDFEWEMDGVKYRILNVPHYEIDAEESLYIDLDVALKMAIIRDLMVEGKIPLEVDYKEVEDVEI